MSPKERPDVEPTSHEPRLWRQGVLDFQSEASQTEEEASPPSAGLFGSPVFSPRPKPFPRAGDSVQSRSHRARVKTARAVRSLFDFIPIDAEILAPQTPEIRPPPEVQTHPPVADDQTPPDSLASPPKIAAPNIVTVASGEKAKARDIIAAIKTLKRIESEKRLPMPDERETLGRFPGFGPVALSIFPDPVKGTYKPGWQETGAELVSLLTPDEYASAKRTTFNAFYTSPVVIEAMHGALKRLGVPADALVLEPGCATGNFMALAPKGVQFIGVELDTISGRIAQARFPNQQIRIEPFQKSVLPQFDAVIGNVPFADLKLDYQGQRLSLHDYFFAKSVDHLAPGGVLALVTSHFTLDKQNAAIREHLAAKADFVGAIRLPSDAFKREGTAVVTDIVFMRRRSVNKPPNHADPDWLGVAPLRIEDIEVPINHYFLNHPEMVLGAWSNSAASSCTSTPMPGCSSLAKKT